MSGALNLKGMSCIVLGAGGFIGTNLFNSLLSAGADVKGFGRNRPSVILNDDQWITGDFSDYDLLKYAIGGCEVVYHLIDDTVPEAANKFLDIGQRNVLNTLQMLDICRIQGVRKIVFASSGGTVYGIKNNFPISEKALTNPICAYGINKLSIEKYIHLHKYLYGLDYTIMRISNPFGPYQKLTKQQGIIGTLISNLIENKPTEIWGNGEVIRDFIYIDDVTDALLKAANYSGQMGILNLGSGIGRSINQIIDDIENIVGKGKIEKVYGNVNRIVDVPINVLNINRIKKALDWSPKTTLKEGLSLTIDWFLEKRTLQL